MGIVKGEWGYNPAYPGTPPTGHGKENTDLIRAEYPNTNNLSNPKYEKLLLDYYKCSMLFLD
jgi:hypothetical protein